MINEQVVNDGEAATEPDVNVPSGYRFSGWDPSDFTSVKEDMDIYGTLVKSESSGGNTEDDPDEVWLISPWIRKGAFLHDRGPMIEDFLRDENKRVFIAYSEPATNNDGKPMMDEEVEPGIKLLDEQYTNFFYVQLPEFHLKNVIEKIWDLFIVHN